MESTVKPCFVRLVRLKTIETSRAKANTKSTNIPLKIPQKKEIKCPVCNKLFKWNCELDLHIRRHTGERPFSCTICNQKFKSQGEVTHHSSTVHSDRRPFSCLWCDKSFKLNHVLMAHLRTHTKEKPFFCNKCPDSFTSSTGLICHALSKHKSGTGKKCEYCFKQFYTPNLLKRHLRIHTGEKPFSCLVCGKSYAQRYSLVNHSVVHSKSKPFKCPECPKTFAFKTSLHNHTLRVHEKVRRHSCGICSKTYFNKTERDRHINTHLNEKPFLCPKCPKRFAHRLGVVYHLKSFHENRKDFRCSECPLAFVRKNQLDRHFLKRHTNPSERPLACLFCLKRYCEPCTLENHLRSHLAEKPHFCNLCSYSSGTSSNLNTHVRNVHK